MRTLRMRFKSEHQIRPRQVVSGRLARKIVMKIMSLSGFLRACILLLAFMFTTNASVLAQRDLLGRWVVDLNRTFESTNVQEKKRYDSMPDRVRENMIKTYQNRTFHFEPDGNVTISFSFKDQPRAVKGKWSYQLAQSRLTISTENDDRSYDVRWESQDSIQLVFRSTDGRGTFKSLFLVRNN